jgi:hypothetical protein
MKKRITSRSGDSANIMKTILNKQGFNKILLTYKQMLMRKILGDMQNQCQHQHLPLSLWNWFSSEKSFCEGGIDLYMSLDYLPKVRELAKGL